MAADIAALRSIIDQTKYADEHKTLRTLHQMAGLSAKERAGISSRAAAIVREIRSSSHPGLMESFLAEYGLSTTEGVALMCLAEAMLRVPDAETIDWLIEDKIAPSDWSRHLGRSSSRLVNASTWALMLTGRVLDSNHPGIAGALRGALRRLGEPVIRTAVARAMRELGQQFVLGENIEAAMQRAEILQARGYAYSYDMLGEQAWTEADAQRYFDAYFQAISKVARACRSDDVRENPGVSVKLSALHPRFEEKQRDRILGELPPRLLRLAQEAKAANMGLNVDAEEADRLALSLDVTAAAAGDRSLAGWDGFGIVVQAYSQRASAVIDWCRALAETCDRRLMVRLVKGAYWDFEIKNSQVTGIGEFPVFTSKTATDASYIANARKLLGMQDRIYPQFATHNAHTAAAILHMAEGRGAFEFQKLHGMGDRLHEILLESEGSRCRVYAPVGKHRDLLAYLVRRLLENGANSSFVNQIVDENVRPETVAADPFDASETARRPRRGPDLFRPQRKNSRGWDIAHRPTIKSVLSKRAAFADARFAAGPLLAAQAEGLETREVRNPARPDDLVGEVSHASPEDVRTALASARQWEASAQERADVLDKAADLYEADAPRLFALLAREAGKPLDDAVGELREAADFLRYYASSADGRSPCGIFTCISPWNFPLAIFTGQVAAALACGNGVLAKPAEQTPLIAHAAAGLMHRAGVPRHALQLLPGDGPKVGAALTGNPRIAGVAFTGSTETAWKIRRSMAERSGPGVRLIAETGGINAMVVDSTALPEQAVRDVLHSAFQSAGQRCSALRCLYVQDTVADEFQKTLFGAMETLVVGDPWRFATDVGPVIDSEAKRNIATYLQNARENGRILKELEAPRPGSYIGPTVIAVDGIRDVKTEVFGPVLHLATFPADRIDAVFEDINRSGFGLTFGLHTRIDRRVQRAIEQLKVGNIYVNRNQIGAVVGSQPFGGEGLSGTGPKAGGPDYLTRFSRQAGTNSGGMPEGAVEPERIQARIDAARLPGGPLDTIELPGPTGESNRLSRYPRLPVLCLGPGEAATRQAAQVKDLGGTAVAVPEDLKPSALQSLSGFSGAAWWGDDDLARAYAKALSMRDGPILPLITGPIEVPDVLLERHVCVDTTASGGDTDLWAEISAH